MPFTHITKALVAEDIIREGQVNLGEIETCGLAFAYFFYGRPAYRIDTGAVIKLEAACPYCFLFDGALIQRAHDLFAFDSGAYKARMYKHVLTEEMNLNDFSLGTDIVRANRLIARTFSTKSTYFDGNRALMIDPEVGAEPWEMEGRAYLHLLRSPGRNEPDDRICSVEAIFAEPVPIMPFLRAVIVPHTHWRLEGRTPWLVEVAQSGVEILPYSFVPGRHPEHYQTLVEISARDAFQRWGVL
jgi:hypothetical protein